VNAGDSLQDNSIQMFDRPSNQNSKLFSGAHKHNQSLAIQESNSILDLSLDKSSIQNYKNLADSSIHAASSKKMISFSKSKQYAKLAS